MGHPISAALLFLGLNLVILLVVLRLNQRTGATTGQPELPPQADPDQPRPLSAADILGWEFEYARTTASEAMQDRHTMINFYLVVAGILSSGVVAGLSRETDLPSGVGTILLWLLCGIGWLYFLKLIRLRQAWHDSARAMNRIKDFYLRHVQEFEPETLQQAFRWQSQSLPPPDKAWTVFFYSSLLIGLLDSVAYVAGAMLLDLDTVLAFSLPEVGLMGLLGLLFFAAHIWLYFAFLRA
jgi:hypothetical protein